VEEAIRLCEERRGRPGEGVGDHVVLGRCYLAAGRLNEARAQYEAAVALDRENVIALKALAGILSHDGQHGAAADFYRAVCRIDPGDLESQSALHQITSGEFPEVRPPDVVVAQGDGTWQPVQPPREEEYLGEISLGLPTFDTFDVVAPKPYVAKVQDFQEMAFDRLDVEHTAPPKQEVAMPSEPRTDIEAVILSPELVAAPVADIPPATPGASAGEDPSAFRWAQLPKTPLPQAGPPKHVQNKSAFETWLSRLKGRH
jgi:tetratricopeptide (TPR) repeat protein